jgi:1-pyrroline-5-carboxylate dehydrogenase
VLEVDDPLSQFMTEQLFAPVLTAYVYDDASWDDTLRLVDRTSEYGLTEPCSPGTRRALARADDVLQYTAGNYYVNDKPTGAAVGQQPFGGLERRARTTRQARSGTSSGSPARARSSATTPPPGTGHSAEADLATAAARLTR